MTRIEVPSNALQHVDTGAEIREAARNIIAARLRIATELFKRELQATLRRLSNADEAAQHTQ